MRIPPGQLGDGGKGPSVRLPLFLPNFGATSEACVCAQPHAGDGNASVGGKPCKQAELRCRGRDRGWGRRI